MRFLKSRRVVTPGGVKPACVGFENGKIWSIDPYASDSRNAEILDFDDYVILPGLVDSHVHVNDPGRAHWEGFATATAAAAAEGCTCIVDMPLNSIPATTCVEALRRKREAARNQCLIDYAFWGGVVPGNAQELLGLAASGVRGFKCFLADSGVEEFARVSEADLQTAMPLIAETGLPLLVHAELPTSLNAARSLLQDRHADWNRYATYLESRPPQAEVEAVRLMIRLSQQHGCRVHIVHVSSAEVLPVLREGRRRGVPITAETCPHYLHFAAENVADGATEMKCAPPIRNAENCELLWEGLRDGILDLIATDHSPCPPELKMADFDAAWGGIASLSLALPVIWTAARTRGFGIDDVCRWMCTQPALLAGLESTKGRIERGFDADFVIFDPDRSFEVTKDRLHFRHRVCPYLGEHLTGDVRQVFLRGACVFSDGHLRAERRGREVAPRGLRACTVSEWSDG